MIKEHRMTNKFHLNLLALAVGTILLTGCGDAETTIIEQDPIEAPGDDHDHDDDHDHGDDGFTIESMGRLAVLAADSNEAAVFEIENGELLDTFSLVHSSNSLSVSADYRFAVISSRAQDYVGFIDGGLWREDHVEHLHDYEQEPMMSDYVLTGSRPTHVVSHDGQLAIFFDGDASSSSPASVQVITDNAIANETADIPTLNYTVNMHGVAEPRGEFLLSSIRRDDAVSTSGNTILPDQVGVYHLHGGEYELEDTLENLCPDLHGAAQNHDYVVFGCSDGVLVAHQHDDHFDDKKIANIEELYGLRIGSVYGHEESESFIGVASAHGGSNAILVSINAAESEMEALEWQPDSDAKPVAYAFSHGAEQFLVLDSAGFLNVLEAHEHDGHMHWELVSQLDISEEDVTAMPDGLSFKMTVAQNGHYVYISDPIAQHILQINLEDMGIEGDIELDFAPAGITWMGIAEEGHDHD